MCSNEYSTVWTAAYISMLILIEGFELISSSISTVLSCLSR